MSSFCELQGICLLACAGGEQIRQVAASATPQALCCSVASVCRRLLLKHHHVGSVLACSGVSNLSICSTRRFVSLYLAMQFVELCLGRSPRRCLLLCRLGSLLALWQDVTGLRLVRGPVLLKRWPEYVVAARNSHAAMHVSISDFCKAAVLALCSLLIVCLQLHLDAQRLALKQVSRSSQPRKLTVQRACYLINTQACQSISSSRIRTLLFKNSAVHEADNHCSPGSNEKV